MQRISFSTANNWDEHPEIQHPVEWRTASSDEPFIVFEATDRGQHWTARLNDFPDEPLWTLIIGYAEILHFDEWPPIWGAQPPLPKKADAGSHTTA